MSLFGTGYGAIGRFRAVSGSRDITMNQGILHWQDRFADTVDVVRVLEAPCRSG